MGRRVRDFRISLTRVFSDPSLSSAPGATVSPKTINLVLFIVIVGGIALRLYAIDASILNHHFIRQADTDAIARNFAEEGMNIFYPRVDWRGASPGYVESEFPFYSYLVAVLYRLFGEHVEIARALNILFFSLTAGALFDFGRRMFDAPTALLAVLFYAFNPLSALFDHNVQPDSLLLLASICALNFYWRWCDDGRLVDLCVSALALCIALLIKPLAVYLAAPMLYLSFRRFGWRFLTKPALWFYGAFTLGAPVLWYTHAYQLWIEYGNTLFRAYTDFDQSSLWSKGFPFKIISYAEILAWRGTFYWAAVGGLLPLFLGAGLALQKKNYVLLAWLAAFAVTMVFFAYQNYAHDYYQWPLVLVASLLMADGVMSLWRGEVSVRVLAIALFCLYSVVGGYLFWLRGVQGSPFVTYLPGSTIWQIYFIAGALLLLGFAVLGRPHRLLICASVALALSYGAWQYATLTAPYPFAGLRQEFAAHVDKLVEPGARIVIAQNATRKGWFQHRTPEGELTGYMPVDFYLSNTEGWSVSGDQARPEFLEILRRRGAKYFAAFCCAWRDRPVAEEFPELIRYLECAYTALDIERNFVIYRLDAPRRRPDGSSCLEPSAAQH
jgi:4-amino-4-deoxy-L-arabinose transferase-like glycosyltransferase